MLWGELQEEDTVLGHVLSHCGLCTSGQHVPGAGGHGDGVDRGSQHEALPRRRCGQRQPAVGSGRGPGVRVRPSAAGGGDGGLPAGLGCLSVSFLISLYYNMVLTWVLWYLLNSFQQPLPWATCPLDLNRTGDAGPGRRARLARSHAFQVQFSSPCVSVHCWTRGPRAPCYSQCSLWGWRPCSATVLRGRGLLS